MTVLNVQRRYTHASLGRGQQSGFSLVELMVAATISLLMMVAVLQLFLDISRTNTEMAKSNVQIENGRFAIQLLANDLMHAGFWDGYVPQFDDLTSRDVPVDYPAPYPATPTVAPEPCTAFLAGVGWDLPYKTALLGISVQTYESVPAGCADVVTSKKAGTDVLVVRHADTVSYPASCDTDSTPASCTGYDGDKVYFQSSRCASAASYAYVLDTSGFDLQRMTCLSTELAEIRRYVVNIYFIRDDNTLMRAEFGGGGGTAWSVQPLVEGVEGFVVELGIDNVSDSGAAVDYSAAVSWANALNKTSPTNRGDGAPDGAFVRCPAAGCTVDQLANVVAAKLYLLVRSTEATQGYTDTKTYTLGNTAPVSPGGSYKRQLYSTAVRLTNVSGRRETP